MIAQEMYVMSEDNFSPDWIEGRKGEVGSFEYQIQLLIWEEKI